MVPLYIIIDKMELFEQIVELVFSGAYWYLTIASIAIVLLENKNPVRTVAWVLLLLFIPYFGLLLYIVFGRSFKRQSRLSRKMYAQLTRSTNTARSQIAAVNDSLVSNYQPLIKLLQKTASTPLSANQNVGIYTDGKTLLNDMLKDIESAKHPIHAVFCAFYVLKHVV